MFDNYYGEVMGQYHKVWVNESWDDLNPPAYYWDDKDSMFYVLGYDDNGDFDCHAAFGANYRPIHKINMLHSYVYKFDGKDTKVRLPRHYQYSLLKCEIQSLMECE